MPPADSEVNIGQLIPIDDALSQAEAGLSVTSKQINRLVHTAFRNGPLAVQRLTNMLYNRSNERAVAVLEGRHPFISRLQIGILRGGRFLGPETRRTALAAIAELIPVLGQREELLNKISDLRNARHGVIESLDLERIRALQPEGRTPTRPRGRKRKPDAA